VWTFMFAMEMEMDPGRMRQGRCGVPWQHAFVYSMWHRAVPVVYLCLMGQWMLCSMALEIHIHCDYSTSTWKVKSGSLPKFGVRGLRFHPEFWERSQILLTPFRPEYGWKNKICVGSTGNCAYSQKRWKTKSVHRFWVQILTLRQKAIVREEFLL
jgi:hypothetical protein